MKSNNNYDEKQIIDRGKAFQYGFISALLTICAVYFITDVIGFKMSSYAIFLVILWIPIMITFIALIIKDAYDGVNCTSGRVILTILGIAGLCIIVMSALRIISRKETFIYSGMLTDSAGQIFSGICMIVISIVYWLKQYFNSKEFKNE